MPTVEGAAEQRPVESATPDISRMVKLILENPGLMAQIRDAVAQDPPTDLTAQSTPAEEADEELTPVATAAPTGEDSGGAVRRQRLLKALRPYVSAERARAIDTVIALSDVLGLMRGR